MKQPKQEFLTSTVKLAVLAALADTPKYGYQIIKEIGTLTEGFFDLGEGALYPVLHWLENEGLLTGQWRETRPGFSRRYYTLTPKGKAGLRSQKEQWEKMVGAVEAIMAGG